MAIYENTLLWKRTLGRQDETYIDDYPCSFRGMGF